MGKTYKESHFPGSKQSGKAAEYQSKKRVRHSKMQLYKEELEKKTKEELISIVIQMQIDIQEERDEIYRRSLSDTLWG